MERQIFLLYSEMSSKFKGVLVHLFDIDDMEVFRLSLIRPQTGTLLCYSSQWTVILQ